MAVERQEKLLAESTMDIVEELERFARERGHSLLELAVAWLASKTAVASVITGATKPDQVRANVKAADWVLTDEEVKAVDDITPPPRASS
jgi:aryl-alcohol dehydrogenase-like predicted oxidoreductase